MNRFIIAAIAFPALVFRLSAGPEAYDHLEAWKKLPITVSGPVREEMVLPEGSKAGSEAEFAEYTYNSAGLLIRAGYSSGGHTGYEYESGQLMRETTYDRQGISVESVVYFYRDKVLTGYRASVSGAGEFEWIFQHKSGELIGGRRLVSGEITEVFTITRRDKYEVVQSVSSGEGQGLGEIVYIYKDGLLTERRKGDPAGFRRIVYTYDRRKRLSRMDFFRNDGQGELPVKSHLLIYTD